MTPVHRLHAGGCPPRRSVASERGGPPGGGAAPPLALKILLPPPGNGDKCAPNGRDQTAEKHREALFCRHCTRLITFPDQRLAVDGAFRHTFFNPQGIVFEIGCFQTAAGCVAIGRETSEFTWFKGFSWRICLCSGCQVHLGWRYRSPEGSRFFGLILDRLRSG